MDRTGLDQLVEAGPGSDIAGTFNDDTGVCVGGQVRPCRGLPPDS
jgi:hypothetical protein